MVLRYLIKSVLYSVFPPFGYYSKLRSCREPNYRYDRDKPSILSKHHSMGEWELPKDGVAKRAYDSYQEYLQHQAAKYSVILRCQGRFDARTILVYRMKFYRRFRFLPRYLPRNARILCLGARQGTEVEVLRDLGYSKAIGIDLNPGPANPFVLPGDFMHIGFKDKSFDFLYSNSIDHAFDIEQFFKEAVRVLKRDGLAIWDIAVQGKLDYQSPGYCAFESVRWEREECVVFVMSRFFRHIVKVESEKEWKWFLVHGTNNV